MLMVAVGIGTGVGTNALLADIWIREIVKKPQRLQETVYFLVQLFIYVCVVWNFWG